MLYRSTCTPGAPKNVHNDSAIPVSILSCITGYETPKAGSIPTISAISGRRLVPSKIDRTTIVRGSGTRQDASLSVEAPDESTEVGA